MQNPAVPCSSLPMASLSRYALAWLGGVMSALLFAGVSHAAEPRWGAADGWFTSAWGGTRAEKLPVAPAREAIHAELGKLPLTFVEDGGQGDGQVRYSLHGPGSRVYFGDRRVTVVLHDQSSTDQREASLTPVKQNSGRKRWVVHIDFVGARKDLRPEGTEQALGKVSYFKGDREQWRTGLPTYHAIRYREVWPGIDLEYRGVGQQLKYTFVVQPGADPNRIRLAYRGAEGVRVTDAGVLAITTPLGGFTEEVPEVYQEVGGRRKPIPAHYRVRKAGQGQREVSFGVGRYDRRQPLIIDPMVTLGYAGYLGGSGTDGASFFGNGIAVDSAGSAYVTGYTDSDQTTFPETGGPDLTHNGFQDAFVAKVTADGTTLVYAGYIGGSGNDGGNGIAVDSAGNAYVTGYTGSDQATFPATGGPDLTYNDGTDAFVAKVRADGTVLVYAGYLGGSGFDRGQGIAVDSAGNAYVTGDTTGSDQTTFPETAGPDLTYNGGTDAFVAKVRADGTALVYAGYLGGSSLDIGLGIAVDSAGNAYVTGNTNSNQTTFPVKIGPDLTFNHTNSPIVFGDAFVAKVTADGTTLVYAGYLGGGADDSGQDIAVDSAGNAYVAGYTDSDQTTFPETGGPDLTYNGNGDAFVAKVRADGTALVYAGYIGGSGIDRGQGIAVDSAGSAYVTGDTDSDQTTFPETGGPDLTHNGFRDAFVAKVRADGAALVYAGYLGGSSSELGYGIAVDSAGSAYVTGSTFSPQGTFPVKRGPDLTHNGANDVFVVKVVGPPLFGIGVFRPATGTWYLDVNRNGKWNGCVNDDCLGPFGLPTDKAVAGDWDGSGLSKIGVFWPAVRLFLLDASGNGVFNGCVVDECAGPLGGATDKPVVGQWISGGATASGVFRPSTGRWYADYNGNGRWDGCVVDRCWGPLGLATDLPVVGDWTGDGRAKIGVYRPSMGRWYADYNGNGRWDGCVVDRCWGPLGLATDLPVVGDWTGDGRAKIGVYRPSTRMWYLMRDGNVQWNGCGAELCRGPFGVAGDQPVVGAW